MKLHIPLILFIFYSTAHGSSCPCDEGVNACIYALETLAVFINRAIVRFKPGNLERFYKFLQNYRLFRTIEYDSPKFAIEGSIPSTQEFKDFLLTIIESVDNFQNSIDSGVDPIEALTEYFERNKEYFENALQLQYETSNNPLVEVMNEATIKFWSNQVTLLERILSELETSTDEALLDYLKGYRTALIDLIRGTRASCPGCLIPCCNI